MAQLKINVNFHEGIMNSPYPQLAERIGLGQSRRVAKLFELIADPQEAAIMLAMPGQAAAIAQRLDLEPGSVQARIDGLFVKGVVFPSARTDPPTFRMTRDLIQFHDASILWPDASQEFLDLWRDYMNTEWLELAREHARALPKPFSRVIPVGVSIPARQQVLDFESISQIIMNAETLAVTKCTCRLTMHNCDRPLDNCLQVNKAAEYNLARGTGRRVDKQEALEICRQAEEQGLIHVTMNSSSVSHFICNCCPCCCQTMPVLIKHGTKVIDPSRFRAWIDPDSCIGCGLCHERCHFGAVSWSDGEGSASVVEADKCLGCGLCMVTCPADAVDLREVRPKDFVPGAA